MDLLLPFGGQPLLLPAARRILPGGFAFQQVLLGWYSASRCSVVCVRCAFLCARGF